jgi:hypothetical protein
MIELLGAFLTDLKNGQNPSKSTIVGQTLRNYVKLGSDCFWLLLGSPLTIKDPTTLMQTKPYLHPYLHELISQQSAWVQPKPRREPYTYRMLATQARFLATSALSPNSVFLTKEYVV